MDPIPPARALDLARPAAAAGLASLFRSPVLVLSPHSDDAAYSAAGVMRALAASGVALSVLTVFGRSGYAPNRPELAAAEVTALRHAEDRLAATAIDRRITVRHWDHPDAALRDGLPIAAVVSKARLDAAAEQWIGRLSDQLAGAGDGGTLLAPLGIGWHRDHRIVAAAAARLARRGRPVHFYEDLPYAGWTRPLRRWPHTLLRLRELRLRLRRLDVRSPDLLGLKRAVFDIYASQASTAFWTGIRHRAERLGGAERLWLTRPVSDPS